MWSFFSRDPTKDFAYDIGEPVSGLEEKSIWHLHRGKKKANGEEVSVFAFDLKNSSDSQVELAKASFKRTKTLRHPNILTYLDGLESEKVLYIVTEPVVPLDSHLRSLEEQKEQQTFAVSWGLHQIVKGLSFLINDCNLAHNNVCMPAIFVDKAGEWKLGGLDYVTPVNGNTGPPTKILPLLEKYDPPEKSGHSAGKRGEKWSSDMWGLGCLVWEVFNGNLVRTSGLKSLGKIPKNLVPHYCELVSANPRSRPNPSKFLENCRSHSGFMDNKFVDTMLFLEEIQIKDQTEKTHFFNSLSPVLDKFPEGFCKHKILPQLVLAFEFGNAGSAVLAPLFKLGKLLDAEEYQRKIIPCVVKLFSSTDRATRVKLLQQIEHFVEHLSTDVVNKQIFPSVAQGFMDTVPMVREQTIKAMLHLAPKLNYKNLNEELLKHFARLQSKDDQGGIRCNTTVCLGKIAGHLNPQMRQKVLSSAYLRALKDPFPPARQAGILAMAASHHFFTLQESATRLLPALCAMTMDPDKGVRDQAFKAIKCFLEKLEKVSEMPELQQEMEKDVNVGGGGTMASAASWAGWAVSGMASVTSKVYRGATKGRRPASGDKDEHGLPLPGTKPDDVKPAAPVASAAAVAPVPQQPEVLGEQEEESAGGGWEDTDNWDDNDWGSMETPATDVGSEQDMSAGAHAADAGGGWDDDDDWGSLEDVALSQGTVKDDSGWGQDDFTPADQGPGVKSASTYNWGQDTNDDDFFTSVVSSSTKKTPKNILTSSQNKMKPVNKAPAKSNTQPAASSQPSSTPSSSATSTAAQEDTGWGDGGWTGDDWSSPQKDNSLSRAEQAKKEREERRAQRQRELQEKRAARQGAGGAMKLGAKKVSLD